MLKIAHFKYLTTALKPFTYSQCTCFTGLQSHYCKIMGLSNNDILPPLCVNWYFSDREFYTTSFTWLLGRAQWIMLSTVVSLNTPVIRVQHIRKTVLQEF